ncbi:MAG: hypothetical protein NVSMB56_07660 [Pyrinomonadaceae bacterium]
MTSIVHAQAPFYTDDADTTDKGKFHFEFFNEHDVLQKALYPAKRQNTANVKLNYGVTDRIELDFDAPLITIFNARTAPQGKVSGIGDTEVGVKYNFYKERETSRLPAMTVAFYVEIPTGNAQKQLGSGVYDYWLYGVAQKSLSEKVKWRTNAGYLFAGNTATGLIGLQTTRGHVFTGNTSIVKEFSPKWTLGAEVFGAVTGNFQLSKGQLEAQIGGNYKWRKNLTLNFGIVGGRFVASPRVGAQIGFSYDFK